MAPATEPPIQGLSGAQVAAILGVPEKTVSQLVTRGFVPALMHGGRWYYRRREVVVIPNARQARWH